MKLGGRLPRVRFLDRLPEPFALNENTFLLFDGSERVDALRGKEGIGAMPPPSVTILLPIPKKSESTEVVPYLRTERDLANTLRLSLEDIPPLPNKKE